MTDGATAGGVAAERREDVGRAFTWGHAFVAAAAFHAAWLVPGLAALVVVYAFCLVRLAGVGTGRLAFRYGFLTGLAGGFCGWPQGSAGRAWSISGARFIS